MTNGNGNDFGNGDKYNEVEFKAEHPKKPAMNVIYKVYDFNTSKYKQLFRFYDTYEVSQ